MMRGFGSTLSILAIKNFPSGQGWDFSQAFRANWQRPPTNPIVEEMGCAIPKFPYFQGTFRKNMILKPFRKFGTMSEELLSSFVVVEFTLFGFIKLKFSQRSKGHKDIKTK